jgi:hypothetical protein
MDVVEQLARMGGVSSRARLVRASSRRAVDRALRRDEIVRDAHGRYAMPSALDAFRVAGAMSGIVSLRSAATFWGWEQKKIPDRPDVTVPRNRKVSEGDQRRACVRWADLTDADIHDGMVTTRGARATRVGSSRPWFRPSPTSGATGDRARGQPLRSLIGARDLVFRRARRRPPRRRAA